MAGHKRGRTCWRPTSRHRRCWDICGAGQAGHTLTVSQRRSSGRAIAPARPCDICGRQRISAMSWLEQGQSERHRSGGVQRALRSCRCPRAIGGRRNHHTIFGAKLFRQHLVEIGVCRSAAAALQHAEPCLVAHFKVWLRKHRGASDPTITLYARDAAHLMAALGDDPER